MSGRTNYRQKSHFTAVADIVCRRTYILPGFFFLLSFFFCQLISEVAEQNSTTIGHMLGSKCNLNTHVRYLGYLLPLQIGGPKTTLGSTSQLNGNFNGLYLWNETRYRQSAKGTTTSPQNNMNFGPQTASKWTAIFYPRYVNSAFYVTARHRRRRSPNRTQPHFAKRRMVNRANNLLQNSWGRPS